MVIARVRPAFIEPFKYCLLAVICADKQKLATDISQAAQKYAQGIVKDCLSNRASTREDVRTRALKLQNLLATTDVVFAREALDLFEDMLGSENFRSRIQCSKKVAFRTKCW